MDLSRGQVPATDQETEKGDPQELLVVAVKATGSLKGNLSRVERMDPARDGSTRSTSLETTRVGERRSSWAKEKDRDAVISRTVLGNILMTRLTPGPVRERSNLPRLTLSSGRCASMWWTRRRTDHVSMGGIAANRTAKRQRLSSGSSSFRTRGTPDREEKGDGGRRTVIAQARPDGVTGGRRLVTDARGTIGAILPLETETGGEVIGTEIGRLRAPGSIVEKENGANDLPDRKERI